MSANKQTNQGSAHAGGSVGLHRDRVQCAMHQSVQEGFGDVSEIHQKSVEVDNAGSYSDITPLLRGVSLSAWGRGGGVTEMEVLDSIRGIGQMDSWEPLVIGVWPSFELH